MCVLREGVKCRVLGVLEGELVFVVSEGVGRGFFDVYEGFGV